jgi:hypothetical protein
MAAHGSYRSEIGATTRQRAVRRYLRGPRTVPNGYRANTKERTGSQGARVETQSRDDQRKSGENTEDVAERDSGTTHTGNQDKKRNLATESQGKTLEKPTQDLTYHIEQFITILLENCNRHNARATFATPVSTALTLVFVTWSLLLLAIARMNPENRSGSPQKRRRSERDSQSKAPAKHSEEEVVFFDNTGIPPPKTPRKPMRESNSAEGKTPELPESRSATAGATNMTAGQEDAMAKALQMMAESLQYLGKQTPPIYASQLPPYPANSVPTFNGNNVTTFLERYEEMAKYYNFTDRMTIDRLTAHCEPKQRAIIQASEEYADALINEEWKTLRDELRKRFRNKDKHQQEERAEYFEHWLLQCQARTNLNILEYLQEFQIRSKRCIEATTIESDRRGFYLVKGLPFRHATKVLERFSLRTDSPKSFEYKKIRDYLAKRLEIEEEARMLNPTEAVKEFEPEVEFKVNEMTNPAPVADRQPELSQPMVSNTFRPAVLNMPPKSEQPKPSRMQSPPGTAATKNEVSALVDKMLHLSLNKVALEQEPWIIQWTPRESELMANQIIRAEVYRQTDEKAAVLKNYMPTAMENIQNVSNNNQPALQSQAQATNNQHGYPSTQRAGYQQQAYRNYGNNAQGYQGQGYQRTGGYNQGYQQNQGMGPNLSCWVCDKMNHQKNDCPTLRAFIDNGWCFLDDRMILNWGTPSNPQGRVTNLGTRRWAETLSAEIKRRWLKRDVDPLTTKAEFASAPQRDNVMPAQNNAISIRLMPDETGAIPAEDFNQFWSLSSMITEDPSDHSNDQLLGQCNNTSVAAATISRGESHQKANRATQGQTGVHKPQSKTILRKPSSEHVPHLRGHKNREDDYFQNRKPTADRVVQFSGTPGDTNVEIKEAPELADNRSKTTLAPAHREKHPKKHRMVEKLEPDAQKVIQQILDTNVQLPLKTLIGNMPEVRKKLFQAGYTPEEFEKLAINTLHEGTAEDGSEEESEDGRPIMGTSVNSLLLNSLPDYVLVEAAAGRVTQCYSLGAEHWTDPEISHVEHHIKGGDEPRVELESDNDLHEPTGLRREYDRAAGIEHLRRDCPKVPIDIRGQNFLTLLDSGAELNTMKRETAEKAMLPITSLPKNMRTARMVAANGSTEGFGGIVWGVPIRIGRIEVRTNFFVVETCTNPIILGNPFLTDARARIEYASNGLTYCKIFSEDGEHSTRFVCTRGDRINAPGLYAGPLAGNAMGAR